MASYYADHTKELRSTLGRVLSTDDVRALHRKSPLLHALVVMALVAVLAGAEVMILHFDRWYLWLPFSLIAGFAIFDFTVLLHDVVHRAVFTNQGSLRNRILGIVYAVPSGISATQFTKWHLDHHAALGSSEEDPKRHHLSPKRNARWYKLLYYTPALFAIYFAAARRESATYPDTLQRTIRLERNLTIAAHLAVLASIIWGAGLMVAWKAYLVPYFFVFPVAFSLNRLGQHYDINPNDPAQWSTLVRGSWFWDIAFLCSNYHLEHHYFPGVPLYRLPRLQKVLMPFYRERGMTSHSYAELFWNFIVLNRPPHANWHAAPAAGEPVAVGK